MIARRVGRATHSILQIHFLEGGLSLGLMVERLEGSLPVLGDAEPWSGCRVVACDRGRR